MHEQTAEAPRWVGYLLLAFGTLLFIFGRRWHTAWRQAYVKQREWLIARLPFLRPYTSRQTAWHAKLLLGFTYLFAGTCLFAGTMTLFRP